MSARELLDRWDGYSELGSAQMLHSAVLRYLLEREAEREATPPAPAVDDEPGVGQRCPSCGYGFRRKRVSINTPRHWICDDAWHDPTPPPAPEPREDAPWLPEEFVVESDGSVWAVGPDGSRSMARANPDNEGGRPDVARYVKVTWDGDESEALMEDIHHEVMNALNAPADVRGVMVDLALDKFRAALGHRPAPEPREDAVEALARVLYDSDLTPASAWVKPATSGLVVLPWERAAEHVRETYRDRARFALDRGAVPGYGPTGDRAGEVRVKRDDVAAVCRYMDAWATKSAPAKPAADRLRAALDGTP